MMNGERAVQVKLLQRKFAEILGEEGLQLVDINTIDGFQVSANMAWSPSVM